MSVECKAIWSPKPKSPRKLLTCWSKERVQRTIHTFNLFGQGTSDQGVTHADSRAGSESRKLYACWPKDKSKIQKVTCMWAGQGRPSTQKTENTLAPVQVAYIVRGQQHIGTQCKYSRGNPYVDVRASQYTEGCLYIEISACLMSKRLCPCCLWCRPNIQKVSLHGLKGKPSSKEVNIHK